MTVTCPACGLKMPWVCQPRPVTVRCPNREVTGQIGDQPQHRVAIYATTDRSRCWHEAYLQNGPDRQPQSRCGEVFRVRAA